MEYFFNFLYIIPALMFGLLMANYATSVLYRLPRQISVLGFKSEYNVAPFCSICHHQLKFYEYLPLLSWLSTLGTCNYCGQSINKKYFLFEALTGIFSIYNCYHFNYSDNYIFTLIIFVNVILSIFLYLEWKQLFVSVQSMLIFCSILYHVMIDGTLYNVLVKFFIGVILAFTILKNNHALLKLQTTANLILLFSIWISVKNCIFTIIALILGYYYFPYGMILFFINLYITIY